MKRIHTIRLKGPWNYRWLEFPPDEHEESPPAAGQVQAPVSWGECFGRRSGCVRWLRRFQSPTNLDPPERVLLSLEGIEGIERVSLNDSDLSVFRPEMFERKYDLTNRLRPSNRLEIDLRHGAEDDPARGGLWCPVVLEIWTTESA